ncbi:hypothetical protein CEXT_482341 [Caerostris extrusa]|uniref:Uncharacterized protein n=1 Tax=Caerostris extrusa TaxID=172846 RepID=A0AAV4P1E2_CAEEX|nr:hypothetical protein CEXT_482341 [Caerostris extrusa]
MKTPEEFNCRKCGLRSFYAPPSVEYLGPGYDPPRADKKKIIRGYYHRRRMMFPNKCISQTGKQLTTNEKYDISKPLNHFLVVFSKEKINIPESFNRITPVYPSSPETNYYGASSKAKHGTDAFELSSVMKAPVEFNCRKCGLRSFYAPPSVECLGPGYDPARGRHEKNNKGPLPPQKNGAPHKCIGAIEKRMYYLWRN